MQETQETPIVSFYRMVPNAVPPMRADKSVLSTLPLAAYQHCEAVRVSSSLGWYIFPASSATLVYDGKSTRIETESFQGIVDSVSLGTDFEQHWNAYAPADAKDSFIPWISALETSGIVQIWSGYCVSTAPGWSIYVKGLTNYHSVSYLTPFEGLVETDSFSPAPLFTNVRLNTTNEAIQISAQQPLFQVFAVPTGIERKNTLADMSDAFGSDQFDWDGYLRCIRSENGFEEKGRYGSEVRKRRKRTE